MNRAFFEEYYRVRNYANLAPASAPTEFYYICAPEKARECESYGISPAKNEIILLLSDPKLIQPFVLDWYGGGRYAVIEIACVAIDDLSPVPFPRLMTGIRAYQGFVPQNAFWIQRTADLPRSPNEFYERAKW